MGSPDCAYCSLPETVEHVLLSCPRYFSARVALRDSLHRLGVPLQLDRILGSDMTDCGLRVKIFRHLSIFLLMTGLTYRL